MKLTIALLVLSLVANRVAAQDDAWLIQTAVTPETLSSNGAVLSGTDSMFWPDGRSVFVTYWLGVNDAVFRCAELRDGEATSPSCWRQEIVAEVDAAPEISVVRRISTRRRPNFHTYRHSYSLDPHVWVGVRR